MLRQDDCAIVLVLSRSGCWRALSFAFSVSWHMNHSMMIAIAGFASVLRFTIFRWVKAETVETEWLLHNKFPSLLLVEVFEI